MALIENPILNSPFREPTRHFKFDDEGITNEILNGRRPSSHFVPIARAKKRGKQLQFETEWTRDRIEPNPVVDRIRERRRVADRRIRRRHGRDFTAPFVLDA